MMGFLLNAQKFTLGVGHTGKDILTIPQASIELFAESVVSTNLESDDFIKRISRNLEENGFNKKEGSVDWVSPYVNSRLQGQDCVKDKFKPAYSFTILDYNGGNYEVDLYSRRVASAMTMFLFDELYGEDKPYGDEPCIKGILGMALDPDLTVGKELDGGLLLPDSMGGNSTGASNNDEDSSQEEGWQQLDSCGEAGDWFRELCGSISAPSQAQPGEESANAFGAKQGNSGAQTTIHVLVSASASADSSRCGKMGQDLPLPDMSDPKFDVYCEPPLKMQKT